MFVVDIIIGMIILVLLDLLWIPNSKLSDNIAEIQGSPIKIKYIVLPFIYLLIATGIVVFVLPKINDNSLYECVIYGGLFGATAYGVYDLTNYALFTDYNLGLALQDMAWGFTAVAIASFLLVNIKKYFTM